MLNIVSTDVDLIPMGLNDALKTNQKYCRQVGGKLITRDCHLAILDEIFVRDTIEFDPTIDHVVDVIDDSEIEEEDNESLSEEENVEEEEWKIKYNLRMDKNK